jgi:formylglycine-generating enzyme required for sulfatase activity
MVVIPGPVEFNMGSPLTEAGSGPYETQHKKRIGRTFAIAAKAVTMEQILAMRRNYSGKDEAFIRRYAPAGDCPAPMITWYHAAEYCNWLSKNEGIEKDQWCYEIKNGQVTKLKENYLSLTGYRLPTEAEMEFATRAGAVTSRYFGETDDLLTKYAWYQKNSEDKIWPVGSLKPNDLGLFDVHGNVFTWCQESFRPYPGTIEADAIEDKEDGLAIVATADRMLRGGSFGVPASLVRSASRRFTVPSLLSLNNGLRVARTLLLVP